MFVELAEKLLEAEEREPVLKPISVEEAEALIDLSLPDEPSVDGDFVENLEKLVLNTPRTATRLFFNQLFGGRQGRAVLGELLTVMLNSSMYTYKVGGPMILMEKQLTDRLGEMVGFGKDSAGTMAPGGSMTNYMGMLMARDWKDPKARYEGVSSKLICYTSIECHYSIQKNAAFAGIGRHQVRAVATDDHGRMDVDDLIKQIKQDIQDGHTPCMINATAGTTVLAAFDPIRKLGEVAQEYDLWLHVDGAYGGSVLFSDKYKHLVDGCEMADSFTLNPHKMLGTPLSTSLITVKNKKHLYDSFSQEATYLYQTANDDYNPGKISLQCGRRNDALKFWTLWKSIGTSGITKAVEHQFDLARYAKEYVKSHPDYTLYNDDDTVAVCFNYKGIDARTLCNSLYHEGELMVGYGRFRDDLFVRLITINYNNDIEDIDRFFEILERFADEKGL